MLTLSMQEAIYPVERERRNTVISLSQNRLAQLTQLQDGFHLFLGKGALVQLETFCLNTV